VAFVRYREALVIPYQRLTFIRNRHRARDLRLFRGRVLAYFEQFQLDRQGLPVDWEGAQTARAEINRMLPRVAQIVEAADLGASSPGSMRSPAARAGEIMQSIFSPRYGGGAYQEVLDVLDMAIGVHDASQYGALVRTVNPFHYVASALRFLLDLPRRALVAIGFGGPRPTKVRSEDVSRFESALSRLAGTEELIESRFSEMREWQSRHFAENADRLTDLGERMDFLERVLAQPRPAQQIRPGERKPVTP
jgi:hypothetical protein